MFHSRKLLLFLLGIIVCHNVLAKNSTNQSIKLPALFSDHAVLQQKIKAEIWGEAAPNTEILITGSWGEKAEAFSDSNGNWKAKIQTPEAGGPHQIIVSSEPETIILSDVMIGEVWLCSGQSNMEMPLKGFLPNEPVEGSEEAIKSADFSKIRMFTVNRNLATLPQEDFEGEWVVCSPKTAGDFSAAAFYFGRKLHQSLNIPIGLIHSSWGGTPAESWTALSELKNVSGFEKVEEKLDELNNPLSEYNVWMDQLEELDSARFFEDGDWLIHPEYSDENHDDSIWESMKIPSWLEGDLKSFDGAIWFRKSFELSEVDENAVYNISLGGIDDEDITFVNSVPVGATKNWTVYRNYSLPKGLLKEGKNTIAVLLFDGASNGGMYGGQDLGVKKDDLILKNLSGDWKYLPTAILSSNKILVFTTDQSFKAMPLAPLVINSHLPTGIYNAMIHPIVPYSIKGAIWYQGENNVSRAEQYKTLIPTMIQSWRNKWGKEFPFYFTQIAPFSYSGASHSESAELRFAQNQTLSLPNTGQAVTLDIGSLETIHPSNKRDVGERLARWALAKDYKQNSLAFSGPVCASVKSSGDNIILEFDIGAESLVAGGSGLKEFELVYADGSTEEVSASILRNTIMLEMDRGNKPTAVRYAWKNGSEASLFNSAELPASTFSMEIEF
jgi:sialate O-acetylesterase